MVLESDTRVASEKDHTARNLMHLVLHEIVDHGEECDPKSGKRQISKVTIKCEGERNCLQRGNSDSDTITTHEPYEIGSTTTSAYL